MEKHQNGWISDIQITDVFFENNILSSYYKIVGIRKY